LGEVKTRLCPPLRPRQALALHKALVEDTLERLSSPGPPAAERHLYLSEPLRPAEELAIPEGWQIRLQKGGDLGERLTDCFQQAFGEGVERLVVVGSDSPTLPLERLGQAFEALAEAAVVLGPARDGGYYLVGASRFLPELFQNIAWGGPQVLAQSLEVLSRIGVSPRLLTSWYDVDTMDDVLSLEEEIRRLRSRGAEPFPRRVAAALRSWRNEES
jgi:hypothetical protein